MSSLFFVTILLTLLVFSHGATQGTSDASFSAWLSSSVRQRESMHPFHSFFEFNRRRRNRLRFRRRCRSDPPRTRTFDGYCNNFRHPMKGAAGRPFKLIAPGSQTGKPTGKDRPNPRVLSNLICDEKFKIPSRRRLTDMTTIFGQFIDHTVTETENSDVVWPIPILKNDSTFTTGGIIPFFRTRKQKTPRGWSPLNLLSSYIDAANIYGGNTKNAEQLRTFKGGKMKMSKGNYLPKDDRKFFVSGDKRVNENPALTSLHTLFFREHNRLCDELKRSFPRWNDKKLYHMARKIVGAQMQAVVYYEFIPAVIGHRLRRYWRYRRRIDPAISNEFSTVAFRVGHTMVNSHLTFIGADNKRRQVLLRNAFFKPTLFEKEGLDSILNGLFSTTASEVDVKISGEVRNFLLANPLSKTHLDLAALNIQRGRDHAIPSYNEMRKAYGLWPVRSFVEVTKDKDLAARLSKAYGGDVNKMDAWIGGLAEDHVWRGSLGPLFKRAWVHEFTRLRDGDRFYFERPRQFPWRVRLRNPTLRALLYGRLRGRVMQHLIIKNTNLKPSQVPRNVFRRVSFRPWFRRPRFRRPKFRRPRFRRPRFRRPRFHRGRRW